jgi:DNA primase
MPGIDFRRLRAAISMEDVLQLVGFEATHQCGDQWYGACPMHASTATRPRVFSVNLRKGCYYCHKCHRKGDQFDLWADVSEMPIREATIDLCHQLGTEIPWQYRW